MQSPKYNLMYAKSIPALSPYLMKIDTTDVSAVLSLLDTYSNYDFGSAAVSRFPRILTFVTPPVTVYMLKC